MHGLRSQFGPLLGSVVDGKKEFSISREADGMPNTIKSINHIHLFLTR